jgi:putative membrane protein
MLWIKALHVFFVVAWFAGLFYLPRLFVYHCEARSAEELNRFCVMERRLYTITTIGMLGTWIFGVWMLASTPGFMKFGWMHAKLTLVLILSGYHGWLKTRLRAFAEQRNDKSARFYRIANEVPAVILFAVLIMVIVRPY